MLETPEVTTTEPQQAAVIHVVVPREQIQTAMEPAIGELFMTLGQQGIAPAGPMFSHHFRVTETEFDFEVGVPVDQSITPSGRVQAGELPGGRVVRATYVGDYEGLGDGWGEFETWLMAHSLVTAEGFWEVYSVGPDSGEPPEQWRTDLYRPLA